MFDAGGFGWSEVAALGRLDLATVPNRLPDRDRVIRSVIKAADGYLATEKRHPYGQPVRAGRRQLRLGLQQPCSTTWWWSAPPTT